MYLTLQDSYIAKNCLIAKFWYIISFTAVSVLLYVSLDSIIDGYTVSTPGGSSQSLPPNKYTEYNRGKCACLFQTAVRKARWLGLNCHWVSRNTARAVHAVLYVLVKALEAPPVCITVTQTKRNTNSPLWYALIWSYQKYSGCFVVKTAIMTYFNTLLKTIALLLFWGGCSQWCF